MNPQISSACRYFTGTLTINRPMSFSHFSPASAHEPVGEGSAIIALGLHRVLARMFIMLGLISALLAQAPAPGRAGASGEEEPTRLRSERTEVIVPVTVTDEKDRFVNNLEASDFRIFDQGKEQKIIYFSREKNQPVVVGFLLDISNATRLHWKTFQDAALELAFGLLPGDKRFSGYLITYSNEDPQAETRRGRGAVRCHLHGLHQAQSDPGRAD
jgi:hypothetical protein